MVSIDGLMETLIVEHSKMVEKMAKEYGKNLELIL